MKLDRLSWSALSLSLLLSACGGGSGGSGAASADFFVKDGPADDLLAFQAEVASIRLRRTDLTLTPNLLAGATTFDFLELEDSLGWVVTGPLEKGDYDAAVVDFTSGSYVALAKDGSAVTVNALSDQLVASFPATLSVGGGYRRVEIDLDLDDSLDGDVQGGMIDFDPAGSSSSSNGSTDATIDEIKGTVVSVDAGAGRLVVDAFVDDDLNVALGEITVALEAGALLLMEDGTAFASESAFFMALVPGSTLLEVHGDVGASGLVRASRIEIEDALGGGGLVVVEIEGTVVDLSPGTGFELLLREVEKGAATAGPVLAGLGNPATITVSYDGSTIFVLDDDDGPDTLTTDASLAVGQEVDVKFTMFSTSPFPAFKVEIEDEDLELEGVITDVSGLPTSFVMHLDDDEYVIAAGQVQSDSTDVTVLVSQATFFLDVDTEPPLTSSELLAGMEVEVDGELSGPPSGPTLTATRVEVEPGELDGGTVTSTDVAAGRFATSGGAVDDPFGGGITSGPLDIVVAPGAVFEGDATSLAELAALFAGLALGETLVVEVEGLATGNADEIEAFEVDVEIED
jgi:hypothetical protein